MNRLEQLEKLMADHAHWTAEVKRLKELGSNEFMICLGMKVPEDWHLQPVSKLHKSCIELVYDSNRESNEELRQYGEYEQFDETYQNMVAVGEVCEHCQNTRKFKAERMNARRRLGQVRSAITRIGQSINKAKGGEL